VDIQCSTRLEHFQTGIFADLNEKQLALQAEGRKIYNLSVGTPDFEPPQHIVDAISQAAMEPENYKYSLRDLPEMLLAVKDYYWKRFHVAVSTDEIVAVDGTQEGMGHLGMALTSPGDVALLPNPGYPIFEAGAYLGGAELEFYPLTEENNFQPDFSAIPEEVARKAKFLVLSYPYNPVCRVANEEVYREAIAFARKYNVIIIHDNAYSDIIFDGRTGGSFLQYEGAKEVGAEFFSLSKSFNVTGCRISFLVGNRKIIDAMKLLRSQYNFGMFLPVQYGAIAALTGPLDGVKAQCTKYQKRRNALCGGLRRIGWNVPDSEGTMFVWAKIPAGYHSSREFCMALMDKAGVVCTPGDAFGSMGEGYVRFALVLPTYELEEMVDVIKESGVLLR
jgi:LL-diaminopimelate aminotransferase